MLNDFRYALRTLRQNPGFALVAILSLALGIGANSAIFSFADALLLRPLPVPQPSRVVSVVSHRRAEGFGGLSYKDYIDFRSKSRSFEGLAAFQLIRVGFAAGKDALPQTKAGFLTSGNAFRALHVEPELGRSFRPEEDQVPGRDAVAVISHDLWQSEFASSQDVIGKTIFLNGISFTVIGVAPEAFTGSVRSSDDVTAAGAHSGTEHPGAARRSGIGRQSTLEARSRRRPGQCRSGGDRKAARAGVSGHQSQMLRGGSDRIPGAGGSIAV
jgi:hypothetical protein